MRQRIYNLIHRIFIPSENNNYHPLSMRPKAFTIYAVITMITIAGILAIETGKFSSMIANITQDLVVAEVNPEREEEGRSPLSVDPKLTRAAEMKAQDMIERDYFSHTDPDGNDPWIWLDRAGYDYALAGENLAIDFNDPDSLMRAWLNSPSHARNIYNTSFTEIGIGVATGEYKGRNTTAVAMFLGKEINQTSQTVADEDTTEGDTNDETGEESAQNTAEEDATDKTNQPAPPPQNEETQKPEENTQGTQKAPDTEDKPEEDDREVSPTQLKVVQVVDDESLEEEKDDNGAAVAGQSGGKNETPTTSNKFKEAIAETKAFLLKIPGYLRWGMSGFLVTILAWSVVMTFLYRHSITFFAPRAFVLMLLAGALWL